MAAVIGDIISDPASRFHNMLATTGISHQHQHAHESSTYRSASRGHDDSVRESSSNPRTQRTGASRFPTPPSSSSPSVVAGNDPAQYAQSETLMESQARDAAQAGPKTISRPSETIPSRQQPSPESDRSPVIIDTTTYPIADATSPGPQPHGQTIKVKDLAHIQNLARADVLTGKGAGLLNDAPSQQVKYEISGMPIGDIIEMVAALLTKITTTNDLQHDAMQRNVTHQQQANQNSESGHGSSMSPLSTSVLAFHGKNIPAITILSYLSRIHKYCPTTYEVFLSLLVYFDRMTERVNDMVVKSEEARQRATPETKAANSEPTASAGDVEMRQDEGDEVETDSDLADDDDEEMEDPPSKKGQATPDTPTISPATYFVVDSFNIHRLIIAGVTCASKFFSDVFYTNSRYAKVGGLPLAELNHLELQFLLLNDFRLAVPVEDLEAYATMLVEFYAREVVVPQSSRPVQAEA